MKLHPKSNSQAGQESFVLAMTHNKKMEFMLRLVRFMPVLILILIYSKLSLIGLASLWSLTLKGVANLI
jgi:hypothetical protein